MKTKSKLLIVIPILLAVVLVAAGLFYIILTSARKVQYQRYGGRVITDLEQLYQMTPQNQAFQESSYDRSGGNGDAWAHDASGESDKYNNQILMDVKGPGMIKNIWFTYFDNKIPSNARLRFYFDGEKNPRIDMSISEMAAGTNAPFLDALALDHTKSSGGYTFYVPLTFAQSMRVEADNVYYWHLGYEMFPANAIVKSYQKGDDFSQAIAQMNASGQLRTSAESAQVLKKTGELTGKDSVLTLADINGSYNIEAIRVNIPELKDLAASSTDRESERARDIASKIRIRMYWDGGSTPAVDATLGQFFYNADNGVFLLKSYALGLLEDGTLYCHFPMPFRQSARIELVAAEDVTLKDVTAQTYYRTLDNFEDTGYFHTKENIQLSKVGEPITILKEQGMGKFVGVSQIVNASGASKGFVLEGDELCYVDGKKTHTITGTGTEDMYQGAWYFNKGLFQQPFYGLIYKKYPDYLNYREIFSMYRHYIADPIPFRSEIDLTVEHSATNETPDSYETKYTILAYYYLVPDQQMIKTDEIMFTQEGAEGHNYSVSGTKTEEFIVSMGDNFLHGSRFYYPDQDFRNQNFLVSSDGLTVDKGGTISYKVEIDPANRGALLRRLTDSMKTGQCAKVYVDGRYVGIWYNAFQPSYDAGVNAYWSDFILPPEYTAGKSSVRVRLNITGGDEGWTEYNNQVYSIIPK